MIAPELLNPGGDDREGAFIHRDEVRAKRLGRLGSNGTGVLLNEAADDIDVP